MTLARAILAFLRERGPQSRTQIEVYASEIGYSPISVGATMQKLKRAGNVVLAQQPGRYRQSIWKAI